MTRFLAIIVVLAVAAAPLASARADATADCFGEDLVRRIAGCTALIERGDQSAEVRAMRALAFSSTATTRPPSPTMTRRSP